FTAILLLSSINAFAQKGEAILTCENDVYRLISPAYTFKLEDDFDIRIAKFVSEGYEQLFLWACSGENELHTFPYGGKMLFKFSNNEVMELTATMLDYDYDGKKMKHIQPIAYYAISNEQLNKLFSGIVKFRVELLSMDKDDIIFQDFQDLEIKKDKLSIGIKKCWEAILKAEEKYANQAEKATKHVDASDGF
ncbi:MAG: hypothetical protein Q4D33_10380, partial [Prevotellaceae bacterium]|nr:hypothetical protein [Prevotellaceae bacterium]